MANKFKPGDIVQLKSGGPAMTVENVVSYDSTTYGCSWFSGAKDSHKRFAEEALQKFVPPPAKGVVATSK